VEDSDVLDRLERASPGEVLMILGGSTLVPGHLLEAVSEAVSVLAPHLLA